MDTTTIILTMAVVSGVKRRYFNNLVEILFTSSQIHKTAQNGRLKVYNEKRFVPFLVEMNINSDIKYELKEALAHRQKVSFCDETRKPSAVLIPIYFWQDQNHILFTRRTELVRYHKGEISFPGGAYHDEDGALINTALRESFEEIGLVSSDVEVLGELDDVPTHTSNYIITPFVGAILPQYKFKLSDFETAELIQIPINRLLTKGCFREDPVIELKDRTVVPFVYAMEGKLITGATARILKQFLDIILL